MIKGSYGFDLRRLSLSKSAHFLFCCSLSFAGVFNFSHDLIRTPYSGIMRICEREILKVCHHPDKSCVHKPCDSEDIMFDLLCDLP